MMPILFSIGPVHFYSFSILLVISWCVFSFLFWKALKDEGIIEERIFDFMFLGTIAAFLSSRIGYVLTHFSVFSGELLKIVAVWVQPGLSFFVGIFGGLLVFWYLSAKYRIRFGVIFDAVALSFPASFLIGSIGSLLDGTEVGKEAALPFAVTYVGHVGLRHPVQVYLIVVLICIMIFLSLLHKRAKKRKWLPGSVGLGFILLFALSFFSIEFLKDTHVYWGNLSANQWICVGLFCEGLGILFVKSEGKKNIQNLWQLVRKKFFNPKKEDRERQLAQQNSGNP